MLRLSETGFVGQCEHLRQGEEADEGRLGGRRRSLRRLRVGRSSVSMSSVVVLMPSAVFTLLARTRTAPGCPACAGVGVAVSLGAELGRWSNRGPALDGTKAALAFSFEVPRALR